LLFIRLGDIRREMSDAVVQMLGHEFQLETTKIGGDGHLAFRKLKQVRRLTNEVLCP
jgi:hypothetical protein